MSAPSARCRLSVDCACGALSKPRDWAASPHFSPLARIAGAPSHRAPSPPRFSAGEKVADGRMRGSSIDRSSVRMTPSRRRTDESSQHLTYSPLIRLRHLLPPQNPRGEKALEGRCRDTEKSAGNEVRCASGAPAKPRDWPSDNAPKAQSTDNRQRAAGAITQRAAGGRQAAGGAT
jgi:hypothetical protein